MWGTVCVNALTRACLHVCSAEVGMVGLLTGRCTQLLHPLTAVSLSNNTLQSFICRYHQLLTNGLMEWRQDAVPVKLESTVWAAGQLPFDHTTEGD